MYRDLPILIIRTTIDRISIIYILYLDYPYLD